MLVGLVGRPSSGKSTFFKAATMMDVLIADYPFATVKANHGMGFVKIDDLAGEFGKVSNPREGYVKGGKRFVPFELMDVAGLVEGASEGKGLGNEFLNDLAAADVFIHVVDMSGESDGKGNLAKDYYPGEDVRIIESELDKWYFGILKKTWKVFTRKVEIEKTEFAEAIAKQFSGLKVKEDDVKDVLRDSGLDSGKPGKWGYEEIGKFAQLLRKYTKPMVIAANKMDRPDAKANFERVKKEFNYEIIECFAEGELALREADKAGLVKYVPGENDFDIVGDVSEKQKVGLEDIKKVGGTGVQAVLNKVVLDVLGYICVFPAGDKLEDSKGNVLPDCYLMKKGSTALDFAFRIHEDIGKGFIKAIDIRTKRAVGKDYKLKHMDGLEIV